MNLPGPRFHLLACLLLVALVLLVDAPLFRAEFIEFDDPVFVVNNPRLQRGLTMESVKWAFEANLVYQTPTAEYFEPITLLSRLGDVTLFGFDPAGHHLTSLLLHLANVLLVYAAVLALTTRRIESLCVAVLFAVHPMNVEPAAWISARKDLTCGLFSLLTLLAFARYVRQPGAGRYALLLAAFTGAILTKPMVVTLPCLLLLLNYWPLNRWVGSPGGEGRRYRAPRLILELLPLFALSFLSAATAVFAQSGLGAFVPAELISWPVRVAREVIGFSEYLGRFFWPVDLSIIYPHDIEHLGLKVALSALFLAGVTLTAFCVRRRLPFLLTGWLWYLGTLAPVAGFIPLGASRMGDRYMYLPMIGLLMALVFLGARAMRSYPALPKAAAPVGMAALVCLLAFRARGEARVWKDTESVFTRALHVAPGSGTVHLTLAHGLWKNGRREEAFRHFVRATELTPWNAPAWLALGEALHEVGRPAEAETMFKQAISLEPETALAHQQLGIVQAEQGRLPEAEASLSEAIRLYPYFKESYSRRAMVRAKLGRWDEAMNDMDEIARLGPLSEEDEALRSYISRRGAHR